MFRSFSLALCFMLTTVSLFAQNKEQGRLENAGLVMEEILNLPDSIPQDLLNKAECVIVVPSMTKVAIGIGGSYGRGAMVCRSGASFDGVWGSPAMYARTMEIPENVLFVTSPVRHFQYAGGR
jgi:SH3 domain-containing YSC84-like protein 1